jgi:hypothetical protein
MYNTSCLWEQAGALDVFGQPSYATPLEIDCWMEPEGAGSNAGMQDSRANISRTILEQTRRPELSLYFDGDDANVRSFKLTDRFTPPTTAGAGIAMMPTVIETMYGPNFDNLNPWTIRVGF